MPSLTHSDFQSEMLTHSEADEQLQEKAELDLLRANTNVQSSMLSH